MIIIIHQSIQWLIYYLNLYIMIDLLFKFITDLINYKNLILV